MLPHTTSVLLRLSFATVLLVGLAHASSTSAHLTETVQPSWISPLPLDGTPQAGIIGTEDDADYFHIEVTERMAVVIYTTGDLDSTGTLLDSEGRGIARSQGGGRGANFHIAALLWPGQYYLRVDSSTPDDDNIFGFIFSLFFPSGSKTGSYNLYADGTGVSPTQVSFDGMPHEGTLEARHGGNYFHFEVTDPSETVIYTSSELDTLGVLLNSEGHEIAINDDGGEGANFRISTITVRQGRYYVRVKGYGSNTGSYTLHVETAPLSATRLSLDASTQEGAIEEARGSDYFAFELTDMTETVIFSSGGLDSVGKLLDSEGREIAGDDDGGEGTNFRISELLWPGQYYVRVRGYGSNTGSYTLHTQWTAVSQDVLSLEGSPMEGAIDTQDDEDYFQISVTEAVAAAIYTTGGLDTAGVLFDPDGRAIVSNDDGGEGFINFRISAILLRPGQYSLRVFSSSSSFGTYTLHAEVTSGSTADAP